MELCLVFLYFRCRKNQVVYLLRLNQNAFLLLWNKLYLWLLNRSLSRKRWLLKNIFWSAHTTAVFSTVSCKIFFRFFSCRLRLHEKKLGGIPIVFYVCFGWKNCPRIFCNGLPVILKCVLILRKKNLWTATVRFVSGCVQGLHFLISAKWFHRELLFLVGILSDKYSAMLYNIVYLLGVKSFFVLYYFMNCIFKVFVNRYDYLKRKPFFLIAKRL